MSTETPEENGHWDHLVPADEWEAVVAEADRLYHERLDAETEVGGADHTPPGITPKRITVPDTRGKNSGSVIRRQLFVIHTAECPLRVGFAQSLTAWGNSGYQPRASWQKFVDPATVVSWVPLSKAAWHAAPANRYGVGYEQAGYARFSRKEWLTPDGLRQIDLLAQEIVRDGIPASGLKWLTTAQVQAVYSGRDTKTVGLCTHTQISPRTRTDPGAGYPKDVLLQFVKHYHAKASGKPSKPSKPSKPTPQPLKLTVDGKWGPATTYALQRYLGTPADGVISSQSPTYKAKNTGLMSASWRWASSPSKAVGSKTIRALQKMLGVKQDGRIGPVTIKALQKRLGTPVDGYLSKGGLGIKELQRRLNKGRI